MMSLARYASIVFSVVLMMFVVGVVSVQAQSASYSPLKVTVLPSSQTVDVGQNATLTASVTGGSGTYWYTWYGAINIAEINIARQCAYMSRPLPSSCYTYDSSFGEINVVDSTQQQGTLTINALIANGEGYRLIVYDPVANITNTTYLSSYLNIYPALTITLLSTVVPYVIMPPSSNKTFTVTASGGTGKYSNYQWSLAGGLAQADYPRHIIYGCTASSSCNVYENNLMDAFYADGSSAVYLFANVTDTAGNTASVVQRIEVPQLVITPSSTTITQGQNVTLNAGWVIFGQNPPTPYTFPSTVSYIWYSGSSYSSCTVPVGSVATQFGTNSIITVNPTATTTYCVEASYNNNNGDTRIYSWPVTVTVNPTNTQTTTSPTTTSTTTTLTTTSSTTTSTTTTLTTTSPTTLIPLENAVINIKPGWNLISVPLLPARAGSSDLSGIVYTELQNNCGLSTYSNYGNLWGYNNTNNQYLTFFNSGAFENYADYVSAEPTGGGNVAVGGNGFWFYSHTQCSINITAVSANAVYPQTLAEHLFAGWNLIGTPFITTDSFKTIASSCNVDGNFYGYNTTSKNYYSTTTPTIGEGYFVYLTSPCNINWTPGSTPPPTP